MTGKRRNIWFLDGILKKEKITSRGTPLFELFSAMD